jgi:hypothetical protein
MAKYGKKAKEEVGDAMRKYKRGELKSGKSGRPVKNPKQAIAIGLSEAREKGAKVPPPPKRGKGGRKNKCPAEVGHIRCGVFWTKFEQSMSKIRRILIDFARAERVVTLSQIVCSDCVVKRTMRASRSLRSPNKTKN